MLSGHGRMVSLITILNLLEILSDRPKGAPETFRPDDDTPYFPVQVRPDVDIWSLGCVFSEVAVWSCFGYVSLEFLCPTPSQRPASYSPNQSMV